MKLHNLLPIGLTACIMLSACATPAEYPSLSTRDSERVSGNIAVPDAPLYIPTPPTPATIEQLGALTADARSAHDAFLAAAGDAREPVLSAQGSTAGTERWAQAQVAIAGLESMRSDAMIALGDIDRLFGEAALRGGELTQLEAARAEVSALVDEENRLIADFLNGLGS